MFKVRVSYPYTKFPSLSRQTPGESSIWGDYQFIYNQHLEECDAWIVDEGISPPEHGRCPEGRLIFFTGEPPQVRRYNPFFLEQFDHVVTPHRIILHRHIFNNHPALPWYIGAKFDKNKGNWRDDYSKTYDELKTMERPKKDRMVSVITSDKEITKEHKRRLRFVRELQSKLGDDIDVFITTKENVLEDKWDALARYKYHIALENSSYPDYWTEKIQDPYLAWCHPLYYGCPNLGDYFPPGSFTPIDLREFDSAIGRIQRVIADDPYEKTLPLVCNARSLVLDRHNFFPYIISILESLPEKGEMKEHRLTPETVIPRKLNPIKIGSAWMRRKIK